MHSGEFREELQPIEENAAALIYHLLDLQVYKLEWAPIFGGQWSSFFAGIDLPVMISDRVH